MYYILDKNSALMSIEEIRKIFPQEILGSKVEGVAQMSWYSEEDALTVGVRRVDVLLLCALG